MVISPVDSVEGRGLSSLSLFSLPGGGGGGGGGGEGEGERDLFKRETASATSAISVCEEVGGDMNSYLLPQTFDINNHNPYYHGFTSIVTISPHPTSRLHTHTGYSFRVRGQKDKYVLSKQAQNPPKHPLVSHRHTGTSRHQQFSPSLTNAQPAEIRAPN